MLESCSKKQTFIIPDLGPISQKDLSPDVDLNLRFYFIKMQYTLKYKNTWFKLGLASGDRHVHRTWNFKYEGRPSVNLCTCYPLTPGDLIHSAMCSNTEIVHFLWQLKGVFQEMSCLYHSNWLLLPNPSTCQWEVNFHFI